MSDHDFLPKPLCRLDDLPLRGSKGVLYQGQSLFLVRQGEHIYLYENRCPHRGISLEWLEGGGGSKGRRKKPLRACCKPRRFWGRKRPVGMLSA